MKWEHSRNLQRRPSIPMKSGQKSSSPIAVAGNLGAFKWLKLRFASPRHWNTIAQVRPDLMWRGWVMER